MYDFCLTKINKFLMLYFGHMVTPLNTLITLCFCVALTHLDKVKVYGKQIRVAPSRHQVVQMPKEGQPVSQVFC